MSPRKSNETKSNEVETVVKGESEVVTDNKPVETVKIDLTKVVKALSVPSIAGVEVSMDINGQTRKLSVQTVIEKFNDKPDETNKAGLTNRQTLINVINELIGFKTPQRLGFVLSGLLGVPVNPTMSLGGFDDVLIGDADKIKLIVNDQTVGVRGRSKSNTEVFEL